MWANGFISTAQSVFLQVLQLGCIQDGVTQTLIKGGDEKKYYSFPSLDHRRQLSVCLLCRALLPDNREQVITYYCISDNF